MGHETKHPIHIKSSSTAMPVFRLWCLSIFTLLSWHEIGRLKNDTEKCGAHVWWQFSVIKVWFCKHELSSMRLQAQRTQDFKTISYLSVNLRKSFCDNQIKNASKKIAYRPVIWVFFTQKEKERPRLSHVVLMMILFLSGDLWKDLWSENHRLVSNGTRAVLGRQYNPETFLFIYFFCPGFLLGLFQSCKQEN